MLAFYRYLSHLFSFFSIFYFCLSLLLITSSVSVSRNLWRRCSYHKHNDFPIFTESEPYFKWFLLGQQIMLKCSVWCMICDKFSVNTYSYCYECWVKLPELWSLLQFCFSHGKDSIRVWVSIPKESQSSQIRQMNFVSTQIRIWTKHQSRINGWMDTTATLKRKVVNTLTVRNYRIVRFTKKPIRKAQFSVCQLKDNMLR